MEIVDGNVLARDSYGFTIHLRNADASQFLVGKQFRFDTYDAYDPAEAEYEPPEGTVQVLDVEDVKEIENGVATPTPSLGRPLATNLSSQMPKRESGGKGPDTNQWLNGVLIAAAVIGGYIAEV